EELNAKYAVVQIGGTVRVMHFDCSGMPVYQTIPDFIQFHHRRTKKNENNKPISVGKWWIAHPERRQHSRVVFAPGADDKSLGGALNLWRGFACEPKQGDCSLYLHHLGENITSESSKLYDYLIDLMAYGIQRPGEQGHVAVGFKGRRGTGKGVAIQNYGRLFGRHYLHITNARHLVGRFNAHFQQCSLLFGDEAFFAGDRQHESVLKGLITEATIFVEPKNVDGFTVPNRMRI